MPASLGWEPHADAWALVVALLGGYLYALSAWGPRHAPGGVGATRRHRLYFFAGVGSLWLAADWPVHQLANELFSVHMGQHLVLSLVTAPLLILGTPSWLLRRLLSPSPVAAVWHALTRPLPALVLFNGWVALYHFRGVVNLSVTNDGFHLLVHALWIGVSLVMWWPVLSPLQEFPHLSYPARMAYLFGQSIIPTVPASFLTFGQTVLYRVYDTPGIVAIDPITDQQVAGLLMKIGGGLFIWVVIASLWFRWSKEEQEGGPDVLYWRDLEHDLEHVTTSRP